MTNDEPAWMSKRLRINITNGNGELVGYIDEQGVEHVVKKGGENNVARRVKMIQRCDKVKKQSCQ